MSGKRIYVDLDDVLAETGRTILTVLARDFGRTIEFDQVVDYDLGKSLQLTPSELVDFMRAVHRPDVLSTIKPMRGAVEVVREWRERGYEIEVVTGRPTSTEDVSRKWLDAAGLPHQKLTHVDKYAWEKELFRSSSGVSLNELANNGYCLAIEDSADVASRLSGLLDVPVVLFDRPWNRGLGGDQLAPRASIVRCHDWAEIRGRFARP